jgi:hypothetical protein
MAGFRIDVHPFQGNHVTAPIYAGFQSGSHSIQVRRAWPLAVSVILPHRFQPSGAASAQLSPVRPSFSETPLGRVRLLPLAVTCPVEPPSEEESIPAACLRYMPGPAATAVEAWVAPATAASIYPAIALRQQKYDAQIAPAALVPNYCQEFSTVPAPQALATFVVPVMAAPAAPQIAIEKPGFPAIAAALPRLTLTAAGELQPVGAAEAAERFVAVSAAGAVAFPALIAMPGVAGLTDAETTQSAEQTIVPAARTTPVAISAGEAAGSPAVAPAASAVPYAAPIALPGSVSGQALTPAASRAHLPIAEAEAREAVTAASVAGAVPYAAASALPSAAGLADFAKRRLACAGYLTVPRAEAAEMPVEMRSRGVIAYAMATALPVASALTLDTSLDPQQDDIIPEAVTEFQPVPAAEAAETFTVPAFAAAAGFPAATRMPGLAAVAAAEPGRVLPNCPFVAGPAAQPVEQFVAPSVAAPIEFPIPAAIAPPASSITVAETHVASSSRLARSTQAEPVETDAQAKARLRPVEFPPEAARLSFHLQPAAGPLADPARTQQPAPELPAAAPRTQELPMRTAAILQFPGAAAIAKPGSDTGKPRTAQVAPAAESTEAEPAESMPAPAKIVPMPASPRVVAPAAHLTVAGGSQLSPVDFEALFPFPQAPETDPARRPGALEPVAAARARFGMGQPERPAPAIPAPGIIALEFYCQRVAGVASQGLRWIETDLGTINPPFGLTVAADKPEDLLAKTRKAAAPAKVRELPLPRKHYKGEGIGYLGKIAAGLLVAAFLWTGGRMMSSNGRTATSELSAPGESTPVTASSRGAGDPGAPAPTGTLARVKQKIAERAAVEVADTFRGGMQAWGGTATTMAAGWSKHPDGYMRTGELALFSPSKDFKDYRLEFYGQIESKSMGWAVRARDKQNYQAMKFTVVEPGLRPIIAMVHYPVVGGKRGHRVETPLSVMVHNHRPYHVTVDVRGNHFTTSIEGEEVDSFTDDTLASGGIGFFSEAGEKARLYWTKVSKNQDWLGRMGAYLSADGSRRTAGLQGPGGKREPWQPGDPFQGEPTLAAAFLGFTKFKNFSQKRRIPSWIC